PLSCDHVCVFVCVCVRVCVCVCSNASQLLRKDGEFSAPSLLDEKEMRANEDMQLKKKNRKSGTPCKVREQEGRGGKVSVFLCLTSRENNILCVCVSVCVCPPYLLLSNCVFFLVFRGKR